ncbi:MAG TPA: F0F1 ATP synthase subunit B [Anaerolineae bacterium]|nr:F0F1 ATP synthase subunit B [Anaerolineae bacterium]HOR00729.1 F0F1 ATP synthase subunit B [Anaerolineae bacterium]HPL30499.1 F0F1 ATP synthase subunit B [Anaerolineae bacterium]
MERLGIDAGVLIAQLVNFFLLLVLLSLVLYRPVTKMLRERSERIAKGLADAELAEKRAAQSEADYQKRQEEARREAQAIVAQAREAAEKERQAILARAQAEAQELRARAEQEIARERREALTALQGQVADLAIDAAGRVLGQAVDTAAHRRLVHDFLGQLEQAS